ncbi:hypothetical protein DTO013E5_8184 [Penicillium roqueforti]|uniref:uncharacterized protein n=1 Tax=Penicillium roqueforti TaxID=5082 RepID=UPI00190BDCB6|nr:uncharacterized protein LCP9604111_3925 [Penicillium roqueforti]KAF9249825.1 hypothetical protein LCP9604111_3925 [Penicillium roqueforti]KAI1830448.1 hypothetical protein CBS147337_8722 [Penicillium roqueforti]KAI2673663.1 hypothetical protein CBS147355_7422 [Penicillium roqueforti]KAI2684954.1 hypothetical protein LCP963914a_5046 [Penicillium roqueforti]KAI2697185.1 hypothetical protein CBS147372_7923 [Penicillium roqueforti]
MMALVTSLDTLMCSISTFILDSLHAAPFQTFAIFLLLQFLLAPTVIALVVAACFSAVQLIGWSRYMMLAVVVGFLPHELRINATASTVTAFVFVGTSYDVSALIAFAQRHQTMFLLHSIFIPYSTMNMLALLNILFHIHGRSLQTNTLQIVNICLPTAFSACYALAGVLIYREYGFHRVEEDMPLLTDEEMQRRQLLRLLGERNTSAPSPDLVRNTYRFDLPDETAQKDWSRLTP